MTYLQWLIVWSALLIAPPDRGMDEGTLYVEVRNIETAQGTIWVGVYESEETFLIKEKAILKGVEATHTGTIRIPIDHVPYGECALAVMHDVNGNGEMDRNWLGIPTEPYAFSRKPRSRWRLPRYREVTFVFGPQQNELPVVLDRW